MLLKKKKLLLLIFVSGFVTNLIWENAQAPLYEGYQNFLQHFPFCFVASIIDGAVILAFYLIISFVRQEILWIKSIRVSDIVILLILGTLTAIAFEKWALQKGTWNYTKSMPLIFDIGLVPLIQLAALSIISIYVVKIFIQAKQKPN